jgi:hypothetical protein
MGKKEAVKVSKADLADANRALDRSLEGRIHIFRVIHDLQLSGFEATMALVRTVIELSRMWPQGHEAITKLLDGLVTALKTSEPGQIDLAKVEASVNSDLEIKLPYEH